MNKTTKIRVIDYLSGNTVQLSTDFDTIVDLDNVYNHTQIAHHSAINQWIVTAANNTVTAVSGGTIVVSGALVTLPVNVVAGGPNSPNLP